MNIISHGFLGIIILRLLSEIRPEVFSMNTQLILLAVFFSLLPDLESLWSRADISEHHGSPFHSPFFWMLATLALLLIGIPSGLMSLSIILLFFLCTEGHLLSDFVTGRFTGIKVLDPIKKKEYSLKKINKDSGKVRPIHIHKKEFRSASKYYFQDKTLIMIEALVWIIGFLSFF